MNCSVTILARIDDQSRGDQPEDCQPKSALGHFGKMQIRRHLPPSAGRVSCFTNHHARQMCELLLSLRI
jgi:hypothetical protein